MSYITVPLDSSHKKEEFSCGKPMLDRYLQKQAKQDVRRMLSACFVLVDEDHLIKGYYTLSAAAIDRTLLPEDVVKKLPPSYIDLPVILLGRLAISINHQKQSLGELVLIDALKRSLLASKEVGSMAVVVDLLDEDARKFYERYDFISLTDSNKMFLPMATISRLFLDS